MSSRPVRPPESHPNTSDIRVVATVTPVRSGGKVVARAEVSITCDCYTLHCGPWRVLSKPEGGVTTWPPDVLVGPGKWQPTVELPPEVQRQVEAAIVEALERGREGGAS